MPKDFDRNWLKLGEQLHLIEKRDGNLSNAMLELSNHHIEKGFIRDKLDDVERHSFFRSQDGESFFRVQYNPKRALRFNGSGIKTPGDGMTSVNNGCFLCRENIRWQQNGLQLGYEIEVNSDNYNVLTNPFPLLPAHLVIASAEHIPQEWEFYSDNGLEIDRIVGDLASLAVRLPENIGFYNGVDAGASIPSHMHYQFFRRPEDSIAFPMEKAARQAKRFSDGHYILEDYPLPVVFWEGSLDDVKSMAIKWLRSWADINASRLKKLTANFISTADSGGSHVWLYFIPREREKARCSEGTNLIGGLEVLGELVFSSAAEKTLLDQGKVDYMSLKNSLACVSTPLYPTD